MKADSMTHTVEGLKDTYLHFPSLLDDLSSQQLGGSNNLISVGDYAFVGQLSSSNRCGLVKEIIARVMRVVPLLNQLSVDL